MHPSRCLPARQSPGQRWYLALAGANADVAVAVLPVEGVREQAQTLRRDEEESGTGGTFLYPPPPTPLGLSPAITACHPVGAPSWLHPHEMEDGTFTASSFCRSLGVSGREVRLSGGPSTESGEETQDVLRDSESSLEQGDRVSRPRRWVVSSFSRRSR